MFQCEPTSQEVIVVRQPWSLSVYAPQMGVQVGSSGGQISIFCYSGTQVTYGQPGFIGNSVWRYTIAIGSTPTSLLITRETKNQSGSTARTEFMKLERSGTWPNYSWLKTDWTLAGQQPLKEVATLGSAQSPGRVEQISVRAPGGPAVLGLSREYTALACGEMMTRETLGTTNSMSSSFDYFSDTTKPGVFGYLRSAALADGNWTAFEYYDTNTPLSFGGSRVKYQFRPYLDAPATPTFDANLGEVTYYTYVTDEYGALVRPNLIEKRVNGTVTARTQIGYGNEAYYSWNGYFWGQLETVSQTDSTGGAETLVTSTKRFLESVGSTIVRGQVHSNTTPDGVRTSYAYQRGTLAGTTFTPAVDGPHSRIVAISGVVSTVVGAPPALLTFATSTIDPVCPVEGKSTLRAVIRNAKAQVVREETHAWVGGAWVLVDHVSYTYDYAGREIERRTQNGLVTNVTFVGGLKTSEVKGDGVVSTYSYDFASRLSSVRREGYTSIGTLTTSYAYNAADQVLAETQTGWNGATLVTSRTFDDAGRPVSVTPPGLGATTYAYDVANRSQTATRPDGSTVTESRYRDGRGKNRTGTGVVPEYFSYGVQSDGRRWSRTDTGLSTSPRWETALVDWAGRTLRKEHPGFTGQPSVIEENTYEATTGRLRKTTRTGLAPTRYEYDLLGSVVRTGLDLNDNGLVLASNDRISEKESLIELFSGAYWRKSMERRYGGANDATVTTVSIVRNRLTGFVSNRLAESQTTDVNGNVTVETIDLDRNSRTSVKTTSRTGISGANVEITENGFPVRSRDFDGLWTSVGYDSLHRPSATTDSRGNVSTTAYIPGTSLKAWIKDATNQTVASFGYDSSGRVIWQADALGHLTRTAYNLRGQVYRQWGGGTYPVEYGYDSTYGDRVNLSTFRGGTGWDGSTWPSSPGTADATTFAFDGPSGLMASKTDAQNRASLYTYNNQAQLATREWARLVSSGPNSGQRVKTTYTYDTATGEQTAITYNDGSTPGLNYSYNRLGLSTSITDDTGSRQMDYNLATGALSSETLNSTFYGGRKLTVKRDQTNTGTLGRITGYQLGTASSPALDQDVGYGYENLARFTTLTTGFANNSSTRTFRYGYEPDSQLLKTLSVDGSPFLVSRTYEDDRDLVTSIESKWTSSPATTFTKFTYTYDVRSQRSSALQDGVAFADYGNATYRQFVYNGRGEVTAAVGYLGTNVTSTAQPLPGRRYEYGYDHIGNRQWANRTGVISLRDDYTANSLNQYVTRENNTVSISGTADASAVVAVNGRNVTAGRQGKFWSDEVTVSNVLNAWRGPISVYATKPSGGNALLRLDSRTAQTAAVLENFTYDLDGNMLSDGLWNYRWDGENRLTRMETTTVAQSVGVPHRILEFRYDYLSRRVQKRVINGTLSQEVSSRRFVYEGWNLIAEYTAPGGSSFGGIVRTFTWGLDIARSLSDSGGVGALVQLADHATGKTFIPTYDGNGNIASMVNASSGSLAAAYEYSPYGEALRVDVVDVALADQPFRFSTKWTDDETGLVYYGRRFYDPRNGRFVGRDPIREKGGPNLYGFCRNDGINRWDVLEKYYKMVEDDKSITFIVPYLSRTDRGLRCCATNDRKHA